MLLLAINISLDEILPRASVMFHASILLINYSIETSDVVVLGNNNFPHPDIERRQTAMTLQQVNFNLPP